MTGFVTINKNDLNQYQVNQCEFTFPGPPGAGLCITIFVNICLAGDSGGNIVLTFRQTIDILNRVLYSDRAAGIGNQAGMVNKNKQLKILKKILQSPVFAKSETYKKILTYLVDCALTGRIPGEIDIATRVLGRDESFDPFEDTLVRVHIYKLRKRLEEYYKDEGKQDTVRLTIPKGHYNVVYESVSRKEQKKGKGFIRPWMRRPDFAVIIVLLIFSLVQWHQNSSLKRRVHFRKVSESAFVWSGILSDNLPVLLVFGNLFAFYEYQEDIQRSRLIRDDHIGSQDDLEAFIHRNRRNPAGYKHPVWEIIPKSSLQHLSSLQPVFQAHGKDFSWKTSDQVTWEDMKQHHIVYIGHFHNLNHLRELLPAHHFSWEPEGASHWIRYRSGSEDTLYSYINPDSNEKQLTRDYILFSSIQGPVNNRLLFIISFNQMGRVDLVNTLMDPVSLNALLEEAARIHGSPVPENFEMLLEIEGYEETALYRRVKHVYEIP
jgi:hypothetical protein